MFRGLATLQLAHEIPQRIAPYLEARAEPRVVEGVSRISYLPRSVLQTEVNCVRAKSQNSNEAGCQGPKHGEIG